MMRWITSCAFALLLSACATTDLGNSRTPVPESLVTRASLAGYRQVRFWGDNAEGLTSAVVASRLAELSRSGRIDPSISSTDMQYLALSGGSSNGAFGAGILVGWTAAGDRPNFEVVTGVSTGALIAPFAFLGPRYDRQLKKVFTTVNTEDIFQRKNLLSIIGTSSLVDDSPLRNLIAENVDDTMVRDIALEHSKGRRLFIGTTNIDAERPVVWDIGRIALSDDPDRRNLIRKIILASASIPGLFPPVRLNVVADGRRYDELHVDGGTSNQVFLLPGAVSARDIDTSTGTIRKRTVYVIRNGKVAPEWSAVNPGIRAIAQKSLSSVIKMQAIGDLYRIYAASKRDRIAFRATWIPEGFTKKEPEPGSLDPVYMRALFDLGFELAESGQQWSDVPPEYRK